MITSLYLLSVGKTLPVTSNCCCLSNVFETIWLVIFSCTFILKVNKFILVCVNNNIFWQIKFIILTATVERRSFKCFSNNYFNFFYIVAKKIMKCLLCSSSFDNDEELIEHYITYHKIDPNNRFFQKLFQSNKNCLVFCKCLRCDDFLTTSDFKIKHDILKHYNEG